MSRIVKLVSENEMAKILSLTKQVLPRYAPKEIPDHLIDAWILILEDYSDQEIRSAFNIAGKTLDRWPLPLQILDIIREQIK